MKDNFIHVCFVIDESGSMYSSSSDVVNGFKKVIDEQKALNTGDCAISLYKFNSYVTEVYRGRDVNEVKPLVENSSFYKLSTAKSAKSEEEDIDKDTVYSPSGGTAMYDGIGTAIDNIGKWLSDMDESQRPSKNLIVIMTDGCENSSHKYSSSRVKEMIKEQEEKYNWSFVYMGTDITTTEYADRIGIKNQAYTTRSDYSDNYSFVSKAASVFRNCDAALACNSIDSYLSDEITLANSKYMSKTGIDLSKNNTTISNPLNS